MGLFSKETHTHIDRDEEGKAVLTKEEVPRRRIFERRPMLPQEDKPLTLEEQFKPRVQPWKTERGQKVIKVLKSGAKRVDTAIVNYNRRSNILSSGKSARYQPRRKSTGYQPRRSSPMYNNYNPFGSTFDTGLKPMSKPKSQGRTKYTIIGGKAYPIAGSKKKTKRKTSPRKGSIGGIDGFDMMDNWGFFK